MRSFEAAAADPGSMLIRSIDVLPGSGRNSQVSVCIWPVFKCQMPVQTDGPALLDRLPTETDPEETGLVVRVFQFHQVEIARMLEGVVVGDQGFG